MKPVVSQNLINPITGNSVEESRILPNAVVKNISEIPSLDYQVVNDTACTTIKTQRRSKPVMIYLADDDDDDIFLFKEAIKQTSVPVNTQSFTSGNDLLTALNNTTVCPDLIFLDINMPIKNGFEILKQLKSGQSQLRIFLLSTADNESYIETARTLGATGYLSKPTVLEQYARMLTAVLSTDWTERSQSDFYVRLERSYARNDHS